MKMKFFKLDSSTFINLNMITNVWVEEHTQYERVYFSLSGEPETRYIVCGETNINAFCSELGIEFGHRFNS